MVPKMLKSIFVSWLGLIRIINGLFIVFTGILSSSPKAFIGDPLFPEKSLDSRSEALRE
jgi:hypothetical protein